MTKTRILSLALVLSLLFVVAASAYALRARNSAIRGWAALALLSDQIGAGRSREANDYREAMRKTVMTNAGIQESDNAFTIAAKLTRHLYTTTKFDGPYVETSNDPLRYVMTINQETFNFCSSLSSTLVWALDLFDVPARQVNFAAKSFFEGKDTDTHTLVEALVDGHPIAFDPTFNATYSCGDLADPIDAKGMVECVKTSSLRHTYLSTPRKGRSLEEYYVPLEALLYAIEATDGTDAFYHYEFPFEGWVAETRQKFAEAR